MNFLTSAISSFTGGAIPYSFGEEHSPNPNQVASIWKVFDGTKKDNGSLCTIFSFDIRKSPEYLPLAQNTAKKLRSLKLPNVLKVLDTFENDTNVYIVTERVTPLADLVYREDGVSEQVIVYLLYFIAKALKYVNVEGSSVLGHLDFNNTFLNHNGEPRLGGFEICTNLKSDPDQPFYRNSARLPGFQELLPPEVSQNGVDVLKGQQTVKFDSWIFGVYMHKLFNNGQAPLSAHELNDTSRFPKGIVPSYKKLIANSLTVRATIDQFLKNGASTYFNTDLIHLAESLEQFNLKTEDEKLSVFQSLETIKNDLPVGLLENRILPELLNFFNQYPTHSLSIIKLILSLSEFVSKDTHIQHLNPVIIKAFTLPDRSVRVLLLGALPKYIEYLSNSEVSDKIFNNFVTGFSDSNPAIREETIRATLFIAPKLSERQLNNELLRFLAKTQSDERPEIRTNTTILIGKIAESLNKSSRSTVLATAFGKALKDPFIHSRIAAILALCSCIEYFTSEIIANKILTVIAPSLLDKSSKVREEAQKAFDLFFEKIKEAAANLPVDPSNDADDKVMKEVTNNVASFGISLSGTFNKITSGLAGSLNQENSITPEQSRTGTPGVVASFDKYVPGGATRSNTRAMNTSSGPAQRKTSVDYNNWGDDDNNDLEFDVDDDGWGMEDLDDDNSRTEISTNSRQSVVQPKVTTLITETVKKPIRSPSNTTAPKKKGLQLKPKSKLKLNVDAGDEDGWGDGW